MKKRRDRERKKKEEEERERERRGQVGYANDDEWTDAEAIASVSRQKSADVEPTGATFPAKNAPPLPWPTPMEPPRVERGDKCSPAVGGLMMTKPNSRESDLSLSLSHWFGSQESGNYPPIPNNLCPFSFLFLFLISIFRKKFLL